MAKFVNEEKKCVAEGEQVFINQTPQCLSVMTGIAFNKDGDYSVSVHDGRIIVTEEHVRHAYWIKKMTVKSCVGFDVYEPRWYCSCCKEKYEPSFAQICKYCYVCGAKMDGDEE